MLTLSCLCGQVRIVLPNRPDFINECNCTLCSKSGVRWAYFHPDEVAIEGATKGYRGADKEDPAAEIRFCEHCGSTNALRANAKGGIEVRERPTWCQYALGRRE